MGDCCREMTLEEEILELSSYGVAESVIKRISNKLESERAYERERNYRDLGRVTKELQQKEVEIRALTGYIALKEY